MKTKNSPIIDLTVASEFPNMMLYENEKKRLKLILAEAAYFWQSGVLEMVVTVTMADFMRVYTAMNNSG